MGRKILLQCSTRQKTPTSVIPEPIPDPTSKQYLVLVPFWMQPRHRPHVRRLKFIVSAVIREVVNADWHRKSPHCHWMSSSSSAVIF